MKPDYPARASWKRFAILALAAVVLLVVALVVGPGRIGTLPAAVSPFALLLGGAGACAILAIFIPWHRASLRHDALVGSRNETVEVFAVMSTGDFKQEVTRATGGLARGWPSRMRCAITGSELQFWVRADEIVARIPLRDVTNAESIRITALNQSFEAVKVELRERGSLTVPIAPSGSAESRAGTKADALRLAALITEGAQLNRTEN